MSTFDGFSKDALAFFEEIAENNNKAWFETNKTRFKREIQQPAQQFVIALGERLDTIAPNIRYDTKLTGSGSIMRIYRDTRFSKDKTPYKKNLGIAWWEGYGKKTQEPGFYFNMSPGDTWMGGGLYMMPDLDKYRGAIVDDELGEAFEMVAAHMASIGLPISVWNPLKRVPRGYDKEHPRAERLKYKGITVGSNPLSDDLVTSPDLLDFCFEFCNKMLPLHQWLVKMTQKGD